MYHSNPQRATTRMVQFLLPVVSVSFALEGIKRLQTGHAYTVKQQNMKFQRKLERRVYLSTLYWKRWMLWYRSSHQKMGSRTVLFFTTLTIVISRSRETALRQFLLGSAKYRRNIGCRKSNQTCRTIQRPEFGFWSLTVEGVNGGDCNGL